MLSNALEVYKKSFIIASRASRSEYWLFQLFYLLVLLAIGLPVAGGYIHSLPLIAFFILTIPAMISVQIRRFHDLGVSGWWLLLNLIPYIGGLITQVWFCFKGTVGPNKFDNEADRVPPSITT
jgi:uncharacterized membrane protein YhaH (DUF805 family)